MDSHTTLIYLLRHGEVTPAHPRRFIGHLDVPLSKEGERQCAAQALRLAGAPLTAVITSDLSRARRSGEILGAPHGLRPEPVAALREMAMGRWDGLTAAEIEAQEPLAFAEWMSDIGQFAFPEGESVGDLVARAWPAFEAIVAAHRGHAIALVAHGGTNRALLCRILGLPLARLLSFGQDYAALSVLKHETTGWCVMRLNERPGSLSGEAEGGARAGGSASSHELPLKTR
jgi:broad specificity phosphatase PhoE